MGSVPISRWTGIGHPEAWASSGTVASSAGDPTLVSCVVVIVISFLGLLGPGRSGPRPGLFQGPSHGAEQRLAVERLPEERNRAGLQGSPACLVVALSSQNDRGDSRTDCGQVH